MADSFYTGAGLRLQRVDGDMAAYVWRKATSQGLIALPVHDEFIASAGRDMARVRGWMDEAFERF